MYWILLPSSVCMCACVFIYTYNILQSDITNINYRKLKKRREITEHTQTNTLDTLKWATLMPSKKVLVGGKREGGIKIAKQIRFNQRKVVFKTKKVLNMKYCQSSFTKRFESAMNLIVTRRISRFSDILKLESPYR